MCDKLRSAVSVGAHVAAIGSPCPVHALSHAPLLAPSNRWLRSSLAQQWERIVRAASGQLAPRQFSSILGEASQTGTMARHNTQNAQKCCDTHSLFKSTVHKGYNVPYSTTTTRIARHRARHRPRKISTPNVPTQLHKSFVKECPNLRHIFSHI